MKIIIYFSLIIFILVSCEKTEYIDSQVQKGNCKVIYEAENFNFSEVDYFLMREVPTDTIYRKYKTFAELPTELERNKGYIVSCMFEVAPGRFYNYAMSVFDIDENDKDKIVRFKKVK